MNQENNQIQDRPQSKVQDVIPPAVVGSNQTSVEKSPQPGATQNGTGKPVNVIQPQVPVVVEGPATSDGTSLNSLTNSSPVQQNDEGKQDSDKELDNIISEVGTQKGTVSKNPNENTPRPIMAAVVALTIALLLGVVAYFAFSGTEKVSDNNNSNQDSLSGSSVTADDVTNATQQIQEDLDSLDDTQDFSSDELGDQSLGLQ